MVLIVRHGPCVEYTLPTSGLSRSVRPSVSSMLRSWCIILDYHYLVAVAGSRIADIGCYCADCPPPTYYSAIVVIYYPYHRLLELSVSRLSPAVRNRLRCIRRIDGGVSRTPPYRLVCCHGCMKVSCSSYICITYISFVTNVVVVPAVPSFFTHRHLPWLNFAPLSPWRCLRSFSCSVRSRVSIICLIVMVCHCHYVAHRVAVRARYQAREYTRRVVHEASLAIASVRLAYLGRVRH